jgi:hypothetical protein
MVYLLKMVDLSVAMLNYQRVHPPSQHVSATNPSQTLRDPRDPRLPNMMKVHHHRDFGCLASWHPIMFLCPVFKSYVLWLMPY